MAQGTATINFGPGATDTKVDVAASAITAGQLVEAWIFPANTGTNTVDNHWLDSIRVIAGNVQAGVGFTIYAKVDQGLAHGSFNVGWVYN